LEDEEGEVAEDQLINDSQGDEDVPDGAESSDDQESGATGGPRFAGMWSCGKNTIFVFFYTQKIVQHRRAGHTESGLSSLSLTSALERTSCGIKEASTKQKNFELKTKIVC